MKIKGRAPLRAPESEGTMATYREFREQTKRRRRKRTLRRAAAFFVVVVIILSLAFVITNIIERMGWAEPESSSIAQPLPDENAPEATPEADAQTPAEQTGLPSSVLAPLPGNVDPGDLSWDTMGPVEQTLDYTVQTPDYRLIGLPENGIVDLSYFDRTVIVGDSVSTGWYIYDNPLKEHAFLCAYKSIGPNTLVNKSEVDGKDVGRGKEVAYDTIINSNPLRMYILLGANSLVHDGEAKEQAFIEYYKQMIDMFRQDLGPDVKIYIQSVTPVRPGIAQSGLNRDRIMRVNNQLAALALEKGCYFLNIFDLLADEDGNLREEYDGDGVHLKPAAYTEIANYMCTHTAWDPANPYLPGSPYYQAPAE